jgi:hypothetical protein
MAWNLRAPPPSWEEIMLRWMRGTSDHPLEDKDDARLLLGDLGEKGPFRALEELAAFLDAVKTAEKLKPVRAFEIVELLDRTARPFLRKLNHEYVTTDAKLTRFQQHRLWYSAHTFLTQLAEGYRFCLARFEVGAVGAAALKPALPKIAGRALRAYAAQLKWSLLRYGPVERGLWDQLARLYAAAEALGFAPWLLTLYRGERRDTSTEREFLRPMMLAVSAPDGLLPIQVELADRLMAQCSDAFVLASRPGDGLHYLTDLTSAFPPGRISPNLTVSPQTRFFGPGDAALRVARYSAQIEATGVVPEEMNLGLQVEPAIVLDTLQHLSRYWAPRLPERKEARRRKTEHVTVVHEFGEVVANAGALFFESPFVSNDEEWIVENESAGGFGAFVPKALGAWLRVGCLVGVRREEGVAWGVGIVRRVIGDEQGNRYVGIQMLATGGAAVTVFPSDLPPAGADVGPEGELCVLLPSTTTRSGETLLLLRPGMFDPNAPLEMHAYDRRYRLEPVAITERGEDFEIARFRIQEMG